MSPADWTCFTYWRSSRNLPVFFLSEKVLKDTWWSLYHTYTRHLVIQQRLTLAMLNCSGLPHVHPMTIAAWAGWALKSLGLYYYYYYAEVKHLLWISHISAKNKDIDTKLLRYDPWGLASTSIPSWMTLSSMSLVRNPQRPQSTSLLDPPFLTQF